MSQPQATKIQSGNLEARGCFSNVSRAYQNNLAKIHNAGNHIHGENFKRKLCTCAQSLALGTCTKFQLEILTRSTNFARHKLRENIKESSRNVSETTPGPAILPKIKEMQKFVLNISREQKYTAGGGIGINIKSHPINWVDSDVITARPKYSWPTESPVGHPCCLKIWYSLHKSPLFSIQYCGTCILEPVIRGRPVIGLFKIYFLEGKHLNLNIREFN